MKQRPTFMTMLIVGGLMAASGFGTPPAATAGDSKIASVTSVQVSKGKLIVKADGKSYSFHGTYENAKGQWVKFDDGKAVGILGKNNSEERVLEAKTEGGRIVFTSASGGIILGPGRYEQGVTQPPKDPEPEPQPIPTPNAFEVKDSKIIKVILISPKT